ncbi:cupin domain-containing protein [Streptomyces olivaceus]|uniref:cupin domain-containing protein n=1 Tax=Streptomyces olivaceus TaxID=47716 RepID=UPI00371EAC09
MTAQDGGAPAPAPGPPLPRILCDTDGLRPADGEGTGGARWRLAEPGRQLDANVVRIPPSGRVDTHTEPDLDVLLHVLDGTAALVCADGERALRAGLLAWLPHGSARSVVAGPDGVTYLTVHRRRPGMRVQPPGAADRLLPAPDGGG